MESWKRIKSKKCWVGTPFFPGITGIHRGGGLVGVVRNSSSQWVVGYYTAAGHTTPLEAELKAIKCGLDLAIQQQISHLEIESDALEYILTRNLLYNNLICYLLSKPETSRVPQAELDDWLYREGRSKARKFWWLKSIYDDPGVDAKSTIARLRGDFVS